MSIKQFTGIFVMIAERKSESEDGGITVVVNPEMKEAFRMLIARGNEHYPESPAAIKDFAQYLAESDDNFKGCYFKNVKLE